MWNSNKNKTIPKKIETTEVKSPVTWKISWAEKDFPVSDDIIVSKESEEAPMETIPMKAHKEVVDNYENKIEELNLVLVKYEKVIQELNKEITELKSSPLEVKKEVEEQKKANFEKAQKERKLNSALDVMAWFGLTILDVKENEKLTEMWLTEREIKLLELEYNSKLESSLDHLSSSDVPEEIREIMFKYWVTLTHLKDDVALETAVSEYDKKTDAMVVNKWDIKKLNKFTKKLLSK